MHPINDPSMLTLRDGLGFQKKGKLAEAESMYRQVLRARPLHATALHLLGIVLAQTGRSHEAVDVLRQSAGLQPNDAVNFHNLAGALFATGASTEALQASERSLQLNPVYVSAYSLRASILWGLGSRVLALQDIDLALSLHPSDANALAQKGTFQSAIEIEGGKGSATLRATDSTSQPADAAFHAGAGVAFLNQRKFALAIQAFERVLTLDPANTEVQGPLVLAKMMNCDWKSLCTAVQHLEVGIQSGRLSTVPFTLVACSDDPLVQKRCAENYFPHRGTLAKRAVKHRRERRDRIRVAYLSSDFHEHATAYLMAQVFELHNCSRFEVVALSFGPDAPCDMLTRLEKAFERFTRVHHLSDEAVAQLIEREEIDIAIDLKGFTKDARPAIFAHKPAPVTVNYLGYPGTLGSECMDYIIGDAVVTPFAHAENYAEKIVQLPHCYQPNDGTRAIAATPMTRATEGLPETGFVFAAFNSPYKITPDVFAVWMRLLHQLPGSVLWLVCESAERQHYLCQEAQQRGIDPVRLVFSRYAPQALHLARHQLADLFLDTVPCNAHTTASDALWAGLPVLTCMGQTFAGRVAASLLTAVGLPELVTEDLHAYEALALHLAHNPQDLADIRSRLWANRTTHPLFDAVRFTAGLEAAYETMHERTLQAAAPEAFAVAPAVGARRVDVSTL